VVRGVNRLAFVRGCPWVPWGSDWSVGVEQKAFDLFKEVYEDLRGRLGETGECVCVCACW